MPSTASDRCSNCSSEQFFYADKQRRNIIVSETAVRKAKSHRHWRFRIYRQLKWLMTGLDVHQETIVACILMGEADETPRSETRTFPTMTRDLFALMTWLESEGVTHIAMESTGIYWKPVYNILEGYFDIALANAQRIKNVPGW